MIESIVHIDADVRYWGLVFTPEEAAHWFNCLRDTIEWKRDEVKLYGKTYVTDREVAWYGDEGKNYRYSGSIKKALPWTEGLTELKLIAERLTGATYNSCLLNYYHNGAEGMGWHSDDEPELGTEPCIASFSFGAERPLQFKHKTKDIKAECLLEDGSLLLMAGKTQQYWKHCLPKRLKIKQPRINLTFRRIGL